MTLRQTLLDGLWDFSDPVASEVRLRGAAADAFGPERAELLTQVARALGLQERFAVADDLLDDIDPDASPAVAVRLLLERGRLRNSAGAPDTAIPFLREAADAAASAGLTFLHVDALHMLAIADHENAPTWTAEALHALATTEDVRTLRWTISLHNNEGWRHFDHSDYPAALHSFEQAKAAAQRWGTPDQQRWAEEALTETRQALANTTD